MNSPNHSRKCSFNYRTISAFIIAFVLILCGTIVLTLLRNPKLLDDSSSPHVRKIVKRYIGRVRVGTKYTRTFRIKNSTPIPVHILDIRTTCGCSSVDYTHDAIPPGEWLEFQLTINTAGRSGQMRVRADVITEPPISPNVVILSADLDDTGSLQISPRYIVLGKISPSYPVHRRLSITRKGDRPVNFCELKNVPSWLTWKVKEATKLAGKLNILLTVRPELIGRGPFEAEVVVSTNDKEFPQAKFWVKGEVVGDLVVEPERCFLGRLVGAVIKKEIRIKSRSGRTVELQSLSHTLGNSTDITVIHDGKDILLIVRVNPSAVMTRSLRGHISIRALPDNGESQDIVIPVFGLRQIPWNSTVK